MAEELVGQTPSRTPRSKLANPAVQFRCRAGSKVLDEKVVRELFPVSPCREEKSFRKLVEVGRGKKPTGTAVPGHFGQHAVNMIERGEEFIAQVFLAHVQDQTALLMTRMEWRTVARPPPKSKTTFQYPECGGARRAGK